jgi:hypothetical protein
LANDASTRARRDTRAELLHHTEEVLADPTTRPPAERPAFRYLESSRRLGQVPPAMSQAEKTKLAEEQADLLVGVIWAVLDGLGLSDEVWEKGRLLAEKALQAVTPEGWEPL